MNTSCPALTMACSLFVSTSLLQPLMRALGDQKTSRIVQLLHADTSVTNVMTGHPFHPVLAASGIDHTVKIFSPEGIGRGLRSRQSIRDEYRIRSRNDVTRQSGLAGAIVTRDMLELLALNIRSRRTENRGESQEAQEGCETM
jgi:hypothetical protein